MAKPISLHLYRGIMQALSLVAPYYLSKRAKRGKEDANRISERLGIYKDLPARHHDKTRPIIWLHGVSVGEVTAVLSLAHALKDHIENPHFIITTNTLTAAKLVEDAADSLSVTHYYTPFDAPVAVARFFDHVTPDFGVIFESDFWPCLMTTAHERGIPLYLASAQMSDKSQQNWQARLALAKAIFAPIKACFCHDSQQEQVFRRFGVSTVTITGSLKLPQIQTRKTAFAKALLKAGNGRLILAAASTHEGEEAKIKAISEHLSAIGLDHFLVIAPRHPMRAQAVAALFPTAKRRSEGAMPSGQDSVYIIDTIGEMASLYQACDIVWLGATFSGKGGHNPLEPASYGKPIISGLSQFKNQYEFDELTKCGVVCQLVDFAQTARYIEELSHDQTRLDKIAKTAKAYSKSAANRADIVAKAIARSVKEAAS